LLISAAGTNLKALRNWEEDTDFGVSAKRSTILLPEGNWRVS
jgi:hypothetical protein